MNNYGESRNDKQVRERFQKLERRVCEIEDLIKAFNVNGLREGGDYLAPDASLRHTKKGYNICLGKIIHLEEISHD